MNVNALKYGVNYDAQYEQNAAALCKASEQVNTNIPQPKEEKKIDTLEIAAVYRPTNINKLSDKERAQLTAKMKQDQEVRLNQFKSLVEDMMQKQGVAFNQYEDMWQYLSSGNLKTDEETRSKAMDSISENGYWGVKQTSERIFDFAMSLSGGDVDKMKEMQAAFEKGYEQAAEKFGGKLPDICQETYSAVTDMFENYYTEAV